MGAPVQEGDILAGKYKVERVLAQGGMGVVVAAIHQQLEQRVALKFLLPEEMKNESVVGRFMREARAAVRLRSEHVARVLDVGTAETGSPYIVMEYLEGCDLSAVIASGEPISVRSAVSYVLQASEAVAEAHALGIVHRDLKPANLFLTHRPDGTPCVKVLDFGISKLVGRELAMTKTNALLGTPYYMSPEQLRSSRDADWRSDIWALGMVLYELLTGSVAYERETLPQLCMAIMHDPLPSARDRRADIPEELNAVIERALAKDPSERYASLADFANALAPFSPLGPASEQRIARVLGDSRAVDLSEPPVAMPAAMPPIERDVEAPARKGASQAPTVNVVGSVVVSPPTSAGVVRSVEEEPAPPSERPRRAWILVPMVSLLVGAGVGAAVWKGAMPAATATPPPVSIVVSAPLASATPTPTVIMTATVSAAEPEATAAAASASARVAPAAPTTLATPPKAGAVAPRPRPSTPSDARPAATGDALDALGPRK